MARALRRARVPAWHTEGFHPHLFVTFALPLPLGQEGEREAMDIRLPETFDLAEAAAALNGTLPQGLRVLSASLPVQKAGAIVSARYRIECAGADAARTVRALLERETLPVVKKTKTGERTLDLKAWFTPDTAEDTAQGVTLHVALPAGSGGAVNPSLFTELVSAQADSPVRVEIVREALLCADGGEFS